MFEIRATRLIHLYNTGVEVELFMHQSNIKKIDISNVQLEPGYLGKGDGL